MSDVLKGVVVHLVETFIATVLWIGAPIVLLGCGFPVFYVVLAGIAQIVIHLLVRQYLFRRKVGARSHLSLATFEAEFGGSEYEREAIEAAYEDISVDRGYPIQRYDLIHKTMGFHPKTLGFHPDDFEELGFERLRKLGHDLERSPYLDGSRDMTSVDDYVRLLSDVIRFEREKPAASTVAR